MNRKVRCTIERHDATLITMSRIAPLMSALCLLAACAAEAPVEPTLPPPPSPPPRTHASRSVPRPQPQPPAAGQSAPDAEAQRAGGPAAAAEAAWHVARDGVVGCADRAALDILRQAAEITPRLLAEARASGGCRTTFRINEWVLVGTEAATVRLRLTNGAPLTLWFQRGEVVAP
ncbi:hypothetical protein [Neoroseomonas lacus]|uniref:Lipoprotein n=1 Tax=Neoroseomonas lacus TaxID=287609 RepID=A0A917KC25_9PROT|nr:hypothetical protein [Neoroseomonas lacus]GGJ08705.1 hypothetical protein GCM10011320_14560 [Neoroseomonas lacus]